MDLCTFSIVQRQSVRIGLAPAEHGKKQRTEVIEFGGTHGEKPGAHSAHAGTALIVVGSLA